MHRHRWKVKQEREQLSAFEQMHAAFAASLRVVPDVRENERRIELKNLSQSDYLKPVIVTYECVGCPAQKVERV